MSRRVIVRGTLVAFAVIGLAVALYAIAVTPPTRDSVYPKCVVHRTTGLHCTGCGTARALHFALNGEFQHAARSNLFSLMVLPALLILSPRWIFRWVTEQPRSKHVLNARWIWLLLFLIFLFTIGRNIPVYPFSLLAPVELP